MKIFYSITAVFLLSLIGCSSTYKVSDFSSKNKFYEDFNKTANEKTIEITLNNDSSFTSNNGAEIENDTLYCLSEKIITENKRFALSDIKDLNYASSNYTSGILLLKNGEKYQAEQIKINRDSIEFAYKNKIITSSLKTSINKVKKVNYKNHWLGVPGGFVIGLVGGLITGVIVTESIPDNKSNPDRALGIIILTPLGTLLGSVYGFIEGTTYTYEFNP